MCVIAHKPAGLVLNADVVRNMWDHNPDGAGFMYAEDGKLHVQKGFMKFHEFLEAYTPHADKKMVLHFRIRTHGATNGENTHPFFVSDNLAFAHNGTISGYGSTTHSDTWHFNEDLLKDLYLNSKNFLEIAAIKKLLADRIGYSKLVFMDNSGNTTIINEEKGEKSSDGIWFSNNSWKPREVYSYPKYQRPVQQAQRIIPVHKSTGNDGSMSTSPIDLDKYKLHEDDLAYVTHSINGLEKYEIVRVVAEATSGINSIGVQRIGDLTGITYYISRVFLSKVHLVELTQKVGHLGVGANMFRTNIFQGMAYCRELSDVEPTLTQKVYDIPVKYLKDIDSTTANFLLTGAYVEV